RGALGPRHQRARGGLTVRARQPGGLGMRLAPRALVTVLALALVAGACSSKDDSGDKASGTTTTVPPISRPAGPAATPAGPAPAGRGISLAAASAGPSLKDAGYTEAEYTASGTATSYTSAGPLPTDGRFSLRPAAKAPYTTRIVVRRPAKQADFNGTVVV